MAHRLLQLGEPAPWFALPSTASANFHFDTVGGRHVVLCFFGSASQPYAARILDRFRSARDAFDDENALFFGVSTDPADQAERRVEQLLPGFRFFWDFDKTASRMYGVATE